MSSLQTYYKILGLELGASSTEIKAAYRKLAKVWHPDRYLHDPHLKQEAEYQFKLINEAYEALKLSVENSEPSQTAHRHWSASAKAASKPANAQLFYEQGAANVKQGQYEDALADFSMAIRFKPDYAKAYRYRGYVSSLLGLERRATADLAKAEALELAKSASSSVEPVSEPIQWATSRASAEAPRPSPVVESPGPGPWICRETLDELPNSVTAIALSRDGKTLVSGGVDGTVRLYNLRTGKPFCQFSDHTDAVWTLALSANGQLLASGSRDQTIKVWHLGSGSLLKTLTGHPGPVQSIAISPNQQQLVSGGRDGSVRFWNLVTGELLQVRYGHADPIWAIAITPDGQTALAGGEGRTVKFYHLKTGELLDTRSGSNGEIYAIAINADSQTFTTGGKDGSLQRWSMVTRQPGQKIQGHGVAISAMALSTSANTSEDRLASGSEDHTIRVWNNANLETPPWSLVGHTDTVTALAFSLDGQTLISGSLDRTLKLWHSEP